MGSIHNPFALLDDDSDSESPIIAPVAKEQPKKKVADAAKKPAQAASSARAPKHGGKDRHSASGRKTDGARKGGRGPHGFGNKNSTTEEHVAEAAASTDKPRRERRERDNRHEEQSKEQEPEEPEGKSYEEYLKERTLVDEKTESRGVNQGSFKGIKAAKVAEVVYDFDEEEEMFRIKDPVKKRKNKARKEKKNLAAELLPGLSGARREAREERPRREFSGERRGNSGRGRGAGRGRGGSRGGASRGGNSSRPSSKGFNALASNERDFPSLGK